LRSVPWRFSCARSSVGVPRRPGSPGVDSATIVQPIAPKPSGQGGTVGGIHPVDRPIRSQRSKKSP
jgi:hypothetical protein